MTLPMEDNFADVVSKAQRGLDIADRDLAASRPVQGTQH